MIEPKHKSNITDHMSWVIDEEENGIYAIGHNSEEEREETRRIFRKNKEAYEKS